LSSSRLTVVAEAVPMRKIGAPDASMLSENCTKTESLVQAFPSAMPRSQRRYGLPASAMKVISK